MRGAKSTETKIEEAPQPLFLAPFEGTYKGQSDASKSE